MIIRERTNDDINALKEKATGSDEKALCGQERRDGDAKR
jgi:hypothetical protein